MHHKNYLAIGGIPAVGKSTLTKALMRHLVAWDEQERPIRCLRFKTAYGYVFKRPGYRVLVLGRWQPDDQYPGTDRLSMSVQPEAVHLLQHFYAVASEGQHACVVAEGDRLYNRRMFQRVLEMQPTPTLHNVVLTAGECTVRSRHADRKDNQSSSFIKGRATKISNLASTYPPTTLVHENVLDTVVALRRIWPLVVPGAQFAL